MQHYLQIQTNNKYKFLNLFDDIIDQKHSAMFNEMILTLRNSNISSIISLQYVRLLSKQNRANVNHTFVFGNNQAEDAEMTVTTLLRPYFIAMGLRGRDEQIKYFNEVTSDHGFFYINCLENKLSVHRLRLGSG